MRLAVNQLHLLNLLLFLLAPIKSVTSFIFNTRLISETGLWAGNDDSYLNMILYKAFSSLFCLLWLS